MQMLNVTLVDFSAKACAMCPIRHRAVCARCDPDEMKVLEGMKSYRTYEPGEVILWRGEPMDFVASVVSGVAHLSKSLEDGRTQMVGLMLPSDFIGRPGRTHVEFDVTATTEVKLCRFDRIRFERLLSETPHIAQRLMEMALDELDAGRDWMILLGRKTAREKIATFLNMLAHRADLDHGSGQVTLDMPMTRDQISDFLGLTLETVSRQLNALKKEGIVAFAGRKQVTVMNLDALRQATGDDFEYDLAPQPLESGTF